MESYVEHANLTVTDLDKAIEFLTVAMPDFSIRKRWIIDDKEWAHVGTDYSYIALNTLLDKSLLPSPEAPEAVRATSAGFNHVGFVVEDVSSLRNRLLEAGFHRGYNNGEIIDHPHRRSVYLRDSDGNEFEFMQYLTESTADRNTYES